ncbi:Hypothetical predicted protein [Olea europaea subsp. europaea]|uniref:Uncharacterized protein n=1 Tax=Olea europaea subsp. europaea TaxID=158383 RepID=A0A8S0TKZ5_OLEEU|nr:Hypothetical predicted protein [Olea europaea subsp. europaea]
MFSSVSNSFSSGGDWLTLVPESQQAHDRLQAPDSDTDNTCSPSTVCTGEGRAGAEPRRADGLRLRLARGESQEPSRGSSSRPVGVFRIRLDPLERRRASLPEGSGGGGGGGLAIGCCCTRFGARSCAPTGTEVRGAPARRACGAGPATSVCPLASGRAQLARPKRRRGGVGLAAAGEEGGEAADVSQPRARSDATHARPRERRGQRPSGATCYAGSSAGSCRSTRLSIRFRQGRFAAREYRFRDSNSTSTESQTVSREHHPK